MVMQTANSERSQGMIYMMTGVDLGAWTIDVRAQPHHLLVS